MGSSTTLNRSRQVPAEDTPAFGGIAERFRRAGDLDRAVALCRDGLKKFPDHLSARVTLGWALLDQGKYEDARIELEQALKRAPDNLAAIRGLAELHDRAEHTMLLPMDGPGQWPPDAESVDELEALANEATRTAAAEHAAANQPPHAPQPSAVFAETELDVPAPAPTPVVTGEVEELTAEPARSKKKPAKKTPADEPVIIEQASAPAIVIEQASAPAIVIEQASAPPLVTEQASAPPIVVESKAAAPAVAPRAQPAAPPVAAPPPVAAAPQHPPIPASAPVPAALVPPAPEPVPVQEAQAVDEVEALVRELAAADTTDPDADVVNLGAADASLTLDQMVEDLGVASASAVEPAGDIVLDEQLPGIDVSQPAALESFLAEAFDSPVVDASNPSGEPAPKDLSPTFAKPIQPLPPAPEESADADIDLDKLVAEVNALESTTTDSSEPLFGSVAVADAFVPSEISTTPPIVAKSDAPASISAPPLPKFVPPTPVAAVAPEPVAFIAPEPIAVVGPEPAPEDPKHPALVLTSPTAHDFPAPENSDEVESLVDSLVADAPNELPLLNSLVTDSLEIDLEAVAAAFVDPEPTGPFLELTNPTIDDFPAPIDLDLLDENPFGFSEGPTDLPLLTLLASLPEPEPEPAVVVPPPPPAARVRPDLIALERLLRKVESRRASLMSQLTM